MQKNINPDPAAVVGYLDAIKNDFGVFQDTVSEAKLLFSQFQTLNEDCITRLLQLQKVANLLNSLLVNEKRLPELATVAKTQAGLLSEMG